MPSPLIPAKRPLRSFTPGKPFAFPFSFPFVCRQCRSLRTITKQPPPVSRFNTAYLPLGASPAAAHARKVASDTLPFRTGALAIKKGMTGIYDTASGQRLPCTVLQIDRAQVVAHKTRNKHGYYAVCVGQGSRKAKNVGNPMLGVFANAKHTNENGREVGVSPKRDLREFRVRNKSGLLGIGREVTASWFQEGQYVDARSKSKGKGFTGVMKRWGMRGQNASHGTSLTHRSMGSSGGRQGSGSRVHPGKKMAGRMGGDQHTVQNLKVLKVDDANGLVVLQGAISGPRGGLVKIQDALKKPWPEIPEKATLEKRSAAVNT